jgi:hypothetical protein
MVETDIPVLVLYRGATLDIPKLRTTPVGVGHKDCVISGDRSFSNGHYSVTTPDSR